MTEPALLGRDQLVALWPDGRQFRTVCDFVLYAVREWEQRVGGRLSVMGMCRIVPICQEIWHEHQQGEWA